MAEESFQSDARLESTCADAGDTRGSQCNTAEQRAILEGIVADGGDGVADDDILDAGAVGESMVADGIDNIGSALVGDGGRDEETVGRLAVGRPIVVRVAIIGDYGSALIIVYIVVESLSGGDHRNVVSRGRADAHKEQHGDDDKSSCNIHGGFHINVKYF